jgi:cytochrome P450 family 2 subfamily B
VFGERFEYTDRQFLRLLELFYQTFSLISSFSSQVSGWEEKSIQGRGNKRLLCG